MPLNRLHTDAEKENLRKKRLDYLAAQKGGAIEKSKKPLVPGSPSAASGGNPTPGGGGVPGSSIGGLPTGDNPTGGNPGGGVSSGGPASKASRKIPKPAKTETEVIVDKGKFYAGLPAFSRLVFRAANNLIKIFNLIPFVPFYFEVEDMTPDEAEVFSEAVKPGLELALPSAGRKHPFLMMISAFVVAIIGKLKARFKKPRGTDERKKLG